MYLDGLKRILRPLEARIQNLIGRHRIADVTSKEGMAQLALHGFSDEILTNIDQLTLHGVISKPPVDVDSIVVFPGGRRENAVVVAVRPTKIPDDAQAAEAGIYCANGAYIVIMPDGSIKLNGKSFNISTSGETKINCKTADITAEGALTISSDEKLTLKSKNIAFEGKVSASSTLTVKGEVSASSTLTVKGKVSASSTLTVNKINFAAHTHTVTNGATGTPL